MSLRDTSSRYLAPFTLPSFILSSPAYATLLPIALGSIVGLTVSRPPRRKNRSQEQYESLKRPPGHPPGWLFGPVWTTLYGMMGYASYRVYSAGLLSVSPAVRQAASVRKPYFHNLPLPLPLLTILFPLARCNAL